MEDDRSSRQSLGVLSKYLFFSNFCIHDVVISPNFIQRSSLKIVLKGISETIV